MDTSTWTFEDYYAFLLVYAAEADFVIREDERQYIIDKIGEQRFITFLAYFKDLKDIERIDLVYDFKEKYCRTQEDGDRMMQEIVALLKEDDHIGAVEEELIISIKRILKHKD